MTYQVEFCGDCLGDLIPSGTKLEVDPSAELRPGDIVSLVLKDSPDSAFSGFINTIGAGGYAGVCKMFLALQEPTDGPPVYLVGQLNPPLVSPIPLDAIEALHLVANSDLGPDEHAWSKEDATALGLLLPFTGTRIVPPVNPDWHP